ncbi:MAG: DNA-directed RNA polymerase subunit H [Candidatus Marsarchaeota archaeon]|nr:DNA-directed RNA polymerase subunit H [Candidatus Marsarchaeota archaeon]
MVSSYTLVPEHSLLSENDAKKVAKKFKISMEKFPKIPASDPQAQKLKAVPGQLISIKRDDGNGEYVYYRYVIKG